MKKTAFAKQTSGTKARSSRRTRRGFALIEVLFAVFIVSLSALIVTATMPLGNQGRTKADYRMRAVGAAQKELEATRGLGYANATAAQLYANGLIDNTTQVAANTYSFTNVDSGSADNVANVLPSGTGNVCVEQVDIDLRRITVTINWSERGVAKSFTIGTLIANL